MPTKENKSIKGAQVPPSSTHGHTSDFVINEKRDTTCISPTHRLDVLKQSTLEQSKKK